MALESLTLDREVMHLRDSLIPRYAELVYYGFWFAPERELLQKMIDDTQQTVNGVVRLELFKGGAGPSAGNPMIPCIMWISPPLKMTRSTNSLTRKGLSG